MPPARTCPPVGAHRSTLPTTTWACSRLEQASWPKPGAPSTQGAAAAAEPAAHDEAMDALAGKLYDRIRSRLKSELLVDRERAGLLTDLR